MKKKALIIQDYLTETEASKEKNIMPADYLVVLQPHQALWDEITSIKEKYKEDFRFNDIKTEKPHITLAMFKQFPAAESRIVQALRNNAKTLMPFKIEMKDFGSYPTHTIYINIVSKLPIMNAVKVLRQNAQTFMKMDKLTKPYFLTDPHLTIARKLQPWQYEKSWLQYQHADFHARFIADHALLLKRKQGEYYKPVEKFMFEGIKQEVTQARLFEA